jgi:hypothetical protein
MGEGQRDRRKTGRKVKGAERRGTAGQEGRMGEGRKAVGGKKGMDGRKEGHVRVRTWQEGWVRKEGGGERERKKEGHGRNTEQHGPNDEARKHFIL